MDCEFSIKVCHRSIGCPFDNDTGTDNRLFELFIRDYTGDAELLAKAFNIKSIRDLGTNKFFLTAQAIAALAAKEE